MGPARGPAVLAPIYNEAQSAAAIGSRKAAAMTTRARGFGPALSNRELTVRGHLRHDLLVVARIELKPSLGIPRRLFRRSPDELSGLHR